MDVSAAWSGSIPRIPLDSGLLAAATSHCGGGQGLRLLSTHAYDVLTKHWWAINLQPNLWDLGYHLFRDCGHMAAHFARGNQADRHALETGHDGGGFPAGTETALRGTATRLSRYGCEKLASAEPPQVGSCKCARWIYYRNWGDEKEDMGWMPADPMGLEIVFVRNS
ncbi:hypothetical protein ASPBRDRAFT_68535 [Aspergillus brasiliensis CBS 101740]|uniref:Uncharacterized protein n=1 Tax=Aspergillus brasiliensis (strain CBS 101740 / IMI 381727 / IBT 21946) TaxID=767769 RepID=A0A1L9U9K2_ASPBC|nr:hypothetical protein ASPBRDRAFT_68535 [Aspergillus brasiliensis CBS 101740]